VRNRCTGQRHKRGDGMHSARTSVPCTVTELVQTFITLVNGLG